MERAAVALLVVAVALAGCVGSGGGSADPAENASNATDPGSPSPTPTGDASASRLTFAGNGTNATVWANGSFAAQDTCNAGGCPRGTQTKTTEITDSVPAGVPTAINLTLTWQKDAVPDWSEVSAWISASGGTFYEYRWNNPEPGRVEVDVLVVRPADGTVTANVFGGRPQADADPNVPYTLRVDVAARPGVVPAGAPVELSLAPGQTVTAEAGGDEPAAFRVYGPDDAAVAYVASDNGTASWTVPSNLTAGSYVLANTWSSDVALTSGGNGTLRALTIDYQVSEPSTYPATGSVQWKFDVSRDPIWVGIYVQNAWVQFVNAPSAMQGRINATVTLPGGTSSGGSIECTLCIHSLPFLGATFMAFGTARASPGLVGGTYQAELTADAAAGYEYGHIVAHYVR